jgi:hypothetical protein
VNVVAGEGQLHARITSQEIAQGRHEAIELVVMQPVPGVLELDDFGIGEMVEPSVALGVRSPAVRTVKQQSGRSDRGPGLLQELVGNILHSPDVEVRIEFQL